MKNVLFLIAFVFSLHCFGQGNDWEWQNPKPGLEISDFYFANGQTGWAVSSFGTIWKTLDSGKTWTQKDMDSTYALTSVFFIDSQTGWVAGGNGIIFKTTDGGENWEKQQSGTFKKLNTIYFKDNQIGWIGGNGCTLKSTNGGQNWELINSNISHSGNLKFFDSQSGWSICKSGTMFYPTIYKTVDGGTTWVQKTPGQGVEVSSVFFIDAVVGWVGSNSGKVYKTTDGGDTWNIQLEFSSGSLYPYIGSLYFIDSQNGWTAVQDQYAGIYKNLIFRTIDGGNNWTVIDTIIGRNTLKLQLINSKIGFGQTLNGAEHLGFVRTNNSGLTWQTVGESVTSNSLYALWFKDNQTGFVAGDWGTILKTTNGGILWNKKSTGTTQALRSIYFTNEVIGWAVGALGTIIKTTDGGETWFNQDCETDQLFNSVYFIDSLKGFAVGTNATRAKTIDGGNIWQMESTTITGSYKRVKFCSNQIGYILTDNKLIKTNNGGGSWGIKLLPDYSINDIFFIDCLTGWAVSGTFSLNPGKIYKTVDGGISWTLMTNSLYPGVSKLHFIDGQNGWATLFDGKVIKSTDGGINWDYVYKHSGGISNVFFANSQEGWAIGSNGLILKVVNGGGPVKVKTMVSSPTFSLYPNPAEESFSLAGKGKVLAVTLIDALGKEQNIKLQAENKISINDVKPGLYWVKIKTTEGVAVERLIKK